MFGRDWLVYSTSIRPSTNELAAWRNSLPAKYTSMTPIYRPRQFAQGLGLGMCEHIGVRGDARPVRNTFETSRECLARRLRDRIGTRRPLQGCHR